MHGRIIFQMMKVTYISVPWFITKRLESNSKAKAASYLAGRIAQI